MIDNIQWLGHGSFMIQGPPLIYIDPWQVVSTAFHPDVILISHDHYEHFSPADVDKLRGPDTKIITNETVAKSLGECIVLRPWQSVTVDRASIKAVPAYSPDGIYHPLEAGGLGFVISVNLYDIYYAGDTGHIPEMQHISPDIAMLPIDNHGTLDVHSAVEVVKMLKPRWVFPSNWGRVSSGATHIDAQLFKRLVGDAAEVILRSK